MTVSPDDHVASHLPRALAYLGGPEGAAVRALIPDLAPGVPLEAAMAFIAGSSATDHLTSAGFHELGLYQVPAGASSGPAPNPNPDASSNTWGRAWRDPRTTRALGRALAMTWPAGVLDQTAAGLWMFESDLAEANARLQPALQAGSMGSPWGMTVTWMAFTGGPGAAAATINTLLGGTTDPSPARLLYAGARAAQTGGLSAGSAHMLVRAWQRLELTRALGGPADYAPDLGAGRATVMDALLAVENHTAVPTDPIPEPPPPSAPEYSMGSVLLALGALGVAGVLLWRVTR